MMTVRQALRGTIAIAVLVGLTAGTVWLLATDVDAVAERRRSLGAYLTSDTFLVRATYATEEGKEQRYVSLDRHSGWIQCRQAAARAERDEPAISNATCVRLTDALGDTVFWERFWDWD